MKGGILPPFVGDTSDTQGYALQRGQNAPIDQERINKFLQVKPGEQLGTTSCQLTHKAKHTSTVLCSGNDWMDKALDN
ncbi:hypothetical protein F444_04175 [Phytophthora nicotianae P1976]|uniref:Uncharacterized protein n=1 Tax=Phytophthora nicotianae P1976 TaxID=1317066 RepID=A0A081ARP3_PHYNI|nr:hypothetical protein F444_04175 [Phytophthora nicotianae P1976]